MVETITEEIVKSDLKEVVNKLRPDSIAKEIEKKCQSIYPLHDVFIRKVILLEFYFIVNNLLNKMHDLNNKFLGQSFEEATYGHW